MNLHATPLECWDSEEWEPGRTNSSQALKGLHFARCSIHLDEFRLQNRIFYPLQECSRSFSLLSPHVDRKGMRIFTIRGSNSSGYCWDLTPRCSSTDVSFKGSIFWKEQKGKMDCMDALLGCYSSKRHHPAFTCSYAPPLPYHHCPCRGTRRLRASILLEWNALESCWFCPRYLF